MAITISVKMESDAFRRRLSNFERTQAPFAIASGLTKTAQEIRGATIDRMQLVLDRPTRFTLNAFRVTPAKKSNLTADVGFKEFAATASGFGSYLKPLEFGGPRVAKRFEKRLRQSGILGPDEFAVPAKGAPLNRYGNIPGPRIVQILSQVRGFNTPGFSANETKGSRARAGESRSRFFFVTSASHEKFGGLPGGIYQRTGRKKRGSRAILIFVKQPTYQAILGFRRLAKSVADRRIRPNIEAALERALATAKLKD